MTATVGQASRQLELESLGEPPWLQEWLPDETLYSFVSRHHFWTGLPRASDTCQRFFGHPTEGTGHDLPARLSKFVERTRGKVGSAVNILQERTVLPYYLIFRSATVRAKEIESAATKGLGGVKARLGILANGLGAAHPLKLCQDCVAEELALLGVSYWHRDHQLPTVWVCETHRRVLKLSTWRMNNTNRFGWALPHHHEVVSIEKTLTSDSLGCLIRLAELTRWALMETRQQPWNAPNLAYNLVAKLLGRDWATSCRGLSRSQVSNAVLAVTTALRDASGNCFLDGPKVSARAHRTLARADQTSTPYWLLLIAAALGLSSNELSAAATTTSKKPIPDPQPATVVDSRRAEVASLLSEGHAAGRAAKTVGVAAGTVIAWASEAGIVLQRSKAAGPKHALIRKALEGGVSQREAGRIAGVSKATVSQLIRIDRALRERWRIVQQENRRQAKRSEWSRHLRSHGRDGATAGRHALPSTYSWLFKHDRDWLLAVNALYPKKPKAARRSGSTAQGSLDLS